MMTAQQRVHCISTGAQGVEGFGTSPCLFYFHPRLFSGYEGWSVSVLKTLEVRARLRAGSGFYF
jgi:hypothetical protein